MSLVLLVLTPLALGSISYVLVKKTGGSGMPAVEYPTQLELGERELGDEAIGQFVITNRGRSALVVQNILTDCSCSGIERERDGLHEYLRSLSLAPSESAKLRIRLRVRGVPIGTEMRNVIHFETNDPSHLRGRIDLVVSRVTGGVFAAPSSIALGTIPIGSAVREVIDIRDTASSPRSVVQVESTSPERVRVRFVPARGEEEATSNHPRGKLIGQVNIELDTAKPGTIDERVLIFLDANAPNPEAIPITGRIAPPVEIVPAMHVLPRQSHNGLVYSATSICRSLNGQDLELIVSEVPPDITAEILSEETHCARLVRITLAPTDFAGLAPAERRVVLRAKTSGHESKVELIIHVNQ